MVSFEACIFTTQHAKNKNWKSAKGYSCHGSIQQRQNIMKYSYKFVCMLYYKVLLITMDPYFYDYLRLLEVFYNFFRLFTPGLLEIPQLS